MLGSARNPDNAVTAASETVLSTGANAPVCARFQANSARRLRSAVVPPSASARVFQQWFHPDPGGILVKLAERPRGLPDCRPEDFGTTTSAIAVRPLRWPNALASTGRLRAALTRFAKRLSMHNSVVLHSERVDPMTSAPWSNSLQAYSMIGICTTATRLSRRREDEM